MKRSPRVKLEMGFVSPRRGCTAYNAVCHFGRRRREPLFVNDNDVLPIQLCCQYHCMIYLVGSWTSIPRRRVSRSFSIFGCAGRYNIFMIHATLIVRLGFTLLIVLLQPLSTSVPASAAARSQNDFSVTIATGNSFRLVHPLPIRFVSSRLHRHCSPEARPSPHIQSEGYRPFSALPRSADVWPANQEDA